MTRRVPTRWRTAVRVAIGVLTAVAAGVGGAAACAAAILAGTALGVPPLPALVLGGVAAVGVGWVASRHRRDSRYASFWTAGLIVLALAASAAMLTPTTGTTVTPRGLTLSDGATMPIRVHERAGAEPPVVVVHGGPGIPFTAADERALLEVIPDRTVVTYDQVGAGGASRLVPSRYSTARAISDLAAVVDSVNATRVILAGYSDGAGIVAAFAAVHPDRVAGLVMISPGRFTPSDSPVEVDGPQSRLDLGDSARLYSVALRPRNLFMYLMTRVDPDAAHAFGGDAEMDARYAELLALAAGGLHCDGSSPSPPVFPSGPPGHYLNQVRQNRPAVLDDADLARIRPIPMLVLRGDCDYIPVGVVDEIPGVLPNARVVKVAESGHALLEDRPDRVRDALTSFLAEKIGR